MVDARADVYALGILLEALLPQPAPKPLLAVALRAHAPEAGGRYHDVRALAREVSRFREGDPVQAYRESVPERLGRVYRRHQLPITLILVYMVVRVLLLLLFRT